MFHWPDYYSSWIDELDAEIAEWIDTGRLSQISAFEHASTARLILCNPYVIHHRIDGLPRFDANQFEVLGDPGLNMAEFYTGVRRVMPTKAEIEAVFEQECSRLAL
jgi:hypothetical protein